MKCPRCNREFEKWKALSEHLYHYHLMRVVDERGVIKRCPYCKATFLKGKSLNKHLYTYHPFINDSSSSENDNNDDDDDDKQQLLCKRKRYVRFATTTSESE